MGVGCSYVWSSIVKALEILKDGYTFRMGVGNISVWYDSSSRFRKLREVVPYVHISKTDLQVKDLWVDGSSDFGNLTTALPMPIMDELCLSSFSSFSSPPNKWIWSGNLDGMFTLALAYNWLVLRHFHLASLGTWN